MAPKKATDIDLIALDREDTIVVEEVDLNPLVEVKPKRDFSAHIAGVKYVFHKNKVAKVSPFVEEMLRKDETKLYL